jgi:AraC-like DNA-binding protein
MRDICTTVAAESPIGAIHFNFFVYEMELHKLRQPFFHSHYYLYLFACGEGEVRSGGKTYPVAPGTLVLVHPWQMHEIVETKHELTYLYITVDGDGMKPLLSQIGAEEPITVYPAEAHLLEFWMKSIRRIQQKNALFITESVFMHTLSYLAVEGGSADDRSMDAIKIYIQENLQNPEMSLRMIAEIFFYSEKYFSYLFREKIGIKFTDYLNDLRIHLSLRLIREGVKSVSELSSACGFMNACYFSKVFKKIMGKSPAVYIREQTKDLAEETDGA